MAAAGRWEQMGVFGRMRRGDETTRAAGGGRAKALETVSSRGGRGPVPEAPSGAARARAWTAGLVGRLEGGLAGCVVCALECLAECRTSPYQQL